MDYIKPLHLISDRVYLYVVEGCIPLPVVFVDYSDEKEKLCEVLINGHVGIVHKKLLFIPQERKVI